MERQKPGNDFDKVIAPPSDNTPRRVKKETTDSVSVSRQKVYIGNVRQRAVVAVFGSRSKLMNTVCVMGL